MVTPGEERRQHRPEEPPRCGFSELVAFGGLIDRAPKGADYGQGRIRCDRLLYSSTHYSHNEPEGRAGSDSIPVNAESDRGAASRREPCPLPPATLHLMKAHAQLPHAD